VNARRSGRLGGRGHGEPGELRLDVAGPGGELAPVAGDRGVGAGEALDLDEPRRGVGDLRPGDGGVPPVEQLSCLDDGVAVHGQVEAVDLLSQPLEPVSAVRRRHGLKASKHQFEVRSRNPGNH
jgi:hypothetical protein